MELIASVNSHNTLHYSCENSFRVETSTNKVENMVYYKYRFVCRDSIYGLDVILWLFVTGYNCPYRVE